MLSTLIGAVSGVFAAVACDLEPCVSVLALAKQSSKLFARRKVNLAHTVRQSSRVEVEVEVKASWTNCSGRAAAVGQ